MAAITTVVIAAAALVVAAGSAYMQYKQGQKAARLQKKAAATSSAEQRAQQQAALRQQVRAERVRKAQIIQASQNDGVTNSSGSLGAQSSLGSMIEGNIASLTRQGNTATAISGYNQGAADATARGNMWGQIGSVASSVGSYAMGTKSFKTGMGDLFGTGDGQGTKFQN